MIKIFYTLIMKRYLTIAIFTIIFSFVSHAQDSSHLRISLLTCAPGNELYSIFGHSALRITDSTGVNDIVFNYGTFNFDEKDFYVKFMRGKLLYYLSIEDFENFRAAYSFDGRSIREQVLNLSAKEKMDLRHALIDNLQESKKYYLYDFFLDNCTTRLRDIIVNSKNPHPYLPAVMPVNTTFRNAIHQYLDKGNKQWSKLGIDLLLGAKTDAVMTTSQQQFLPNNLMISIDSCKNNNLIETTQLYDAMPVDTKNDWLSPILFFSLLLLLMLFLYRAPNTKLHLIAAGLDNFIFFMTGLLGILLILMWVATDHKMTKDNYNILWAWPTHLLIVFFSTKLKWVRKYYLLHCTFLCLTLISWYFLPQQMNAALIPFVVMLAYLSFRKSFKIS